MKKFLIKWIGIIKPLVILGFVLPLDTLGYIYMALASSSKLTPLEGLIFAFTIGLTMFTIVCFVELCSKIERMLMDWLNEE